MTKGEMGIRRLLCWTASVAGRQGYKGGRAKARPCAAASPEAGGVGEAGWCAVAAARGAPLMLTLYRFVTMSGGRGRMLLSIKAIPAYGHEGGRADRGVGGEELVASFAAGCTTQSNTATRYRQTCPQEQRDMICSVAHRPDSVAIDEGPYEARRDNARELLRSMCERVSSLSEGHRKHRVQAAFRKVSSCDF
jgi:hypothetical protein